MIEVERKLSRIIFPASVVTFLLLMLAGAGIFVLKAVLFSGEIITPEDIAGGICGSICFSLLVFPLLFELHDYVKKGGIGVDEKVIILKTSQPKEIRHENIEKIEVEFWIRVEKKSFKMNVAIRTISIIPKGNIRPYHVSAASFTQEQLTKLYCALKTSSKLRNVIEGRYHGNDYNVASHLSGKSIREFKYEEVKDYMDYIDSLCPYYLKSLELEDSK